MKYNFDELVNRRGTGCVKYDKVDRNLLPLWVADMDFKTPDFIIDAIEKRLECPVLGYPFIPKDFFPTVSRWVKNLHGWEVSPEHMRYVPGIKAVPPQASFLMWLDCRALGMSQKDLMYMLKVKAHLFLNDGTMFGPEGTGFVRLNVGCPRSILVQAMQQLKEAVK